MVTSTVSADDEIENDKPKATVTQSLEMNLMNRDWLSRNRSE